MAYIGKPPNTTGKDAGPSLKLDDISSGFNGNTKVFDLTVAGTSVDPHVNNTQIYLSGVHQLPGTAYTLSGSQIVFTAAPSSSLSFHGAMIGDATLFTPNQDTIEPAAFTDNARTALSGSLGVNGSLIRSLNATIISGSFSQTHLSSKISGIISGAAQLPSGVVSASVLSSPAQGTIRLATNGVNNDVDSGLQAGDSPTFAGGTVTGNLSVGGTLTAQEIHTEFTSASIMFSSGSTKFGDTIDDTHQVTGSLLMTGSMAVGTGRGITPNGIFEVGLNTDGTRRFSVSFEDSLVSLSAKNQSNNGEVLKLMGDGLRIHTGTNTSGTEKMRIDSSGNVGIGTNNPGSPLDVSSAEAANTANFNSTNGATNITLKSSGTLIGQMEFSGGGPSQIVTRTTASLALGSNNVQTLFITDADDVGIGTSSPTTKFEVYDDSSGADFTTVEYDYNTKNRKLRFGIAGGNPSIQGTLSNDSATSLAINPSGGSVGIGISTPSNRLDVKETANARAVQIDSTSTGLGNDLLFLLASGMSSNSGFNFLVTKTGADNDFQHALRGDGDLDADGSYSSGGADYAEYFESKDGSSIPVGTTVKLDGEKIVSCSVGDVPLGVIRPKKGSATVGNAATFRWSQKYLKDDYGDYQMEQCTMTTWDIPSSGSNSDNKTITYFTDRIPSDVTVPSGSRIISTKDDGSPLMRRKFNPNYSSSLTYVSREDRDEWNIVGLLGQIPVTKGQPTGSQWVKMKDISDTVELWFVK